MSQPAASVAVMEIVVWVMFWLLVVALAFAWSGRRGGRGARLAPPPMAPGGVTPMRAQAPPAPSSSSLGEPTGRPDPLGPRDRRDREDEGFADGLIIGHYLTRRYDEAELHALAEELAALQEEVDPWFLGENDDAWDDADAS
jgi:hypothetical protein